MNLKPETRAELAHYGRKLTLVVFSVVAIFFALMLVFYALLALGIAHGEFR